MEWQVDEVLLQEVRNWKKCWSTSGNSKLKFYLLYDSWEQDDGSNCQLILVFINNIQWFVKNMMADWNAKELILKKAICSGYWKRQNIYEDWVGTTHYFMGQLALNLKSLNLIIRILNWFHNKVLAFLKNN